MHTHTHIYTACFTDIPLSYIYIYTVSPHRVEHLLYRTDSPLSYIYTYILRFTTQSQHMFFPTQMAQFYRTDSPLSYIYTYIYIYIYTYTHTYILRFTTQSRHIFFHTDGLVLPHSGNQQSGWWLIHHHLTHPYVHTHTHKCTVCVTNSPSSYIHICMYISVSPHRVKHLSYHTDSPPSCMYIHIHTYSVSPHRVNICFTTQMAQFYHTRETHNLDGDLSITILYTRICTHIYCLFYR